MGTWGVGIYQNDSALDWIEINGGEHGFIDTIHDRWDELGINVHMRNDKLKVSLDFDLEYDTLHQLGSLEQGILVWCDIVTKHKVPIYAYEWYGTLKALESCHGNTIWLFDWDDDELDERLEIFDDLRRKLREHRKNGYIIQGEED